MKIIGLTGGIGSGKSTVARVFQSLGVPIYFADDRAKQLYLDDSVLKAQVIQHFGELSYQNGSLNRSHLAEVVFQSKEKLQLLNSLVHPRVANDFRSWLDQQHTEYVVKEAAILFESGSYVDCNVTVTVSAPVQERIKRVQTRDQTTSDLVENRIKSQMTDTERKALADFEILNFSFHLITEQVISIHKSIVSA